MCVCVFAAAAAADCARIVRFGGCCWLRLFVCAGLISLRVCVSSTLILKSRSQAQQVFPLISRRERKRRKKLSLISVGWQLYLCDHHGGQSSEPSFLRQLDLGGDGDGGCHNRPEIELRPPGSVAAARSARRSFNQSGGQIFRYRSLNLVAELAICLLVLLLR